MRWEARRWACYVGVAGALGPAWFLLLQLPGTTRTFLWHSGAARSLALLVLTSVLVAVTLRPWIVRPECDLRMAILGPYWGALLFALASAVTTWIGNGFRTLNYVDLFVRLPLWALIVSLMFFWLVIPAGYLCQRVIRWAAGE
jgi:hypothetical protein